MAQKVLVLDLTTGRAKQSSGTFLESADATTTPTADKVLLADGSGKITGAWIGDVLTLAQLPVASDGEVSATELVRADDSRLGNPAVGGDLSGTASAATVIKLQGRAVANVSPSDGQVLTWDNADARWEPVTPSGGGAGLTVRDIDGSPSVSPVTTIRVTNGALADEGGGVVTLTLGGGSDSIGGILYLFDTYR